MLAAAGTRHRIGAGRPAGDGGASPLSVAESNNHAAWSRPLVNGQRPVSWYPPSTGEARPGGVSEPQRRSCGRAWTRAAASSDMRAAANADPQTTKATQAAEAS